MNSRHRRKAAAEKYNSRRLKLAKLDWLHNLMYQRTGRRVRFIDVSSDAALERAIITAKTALETPVTKAKSRVIVAGGDAKVGVVLAAAAMTGPASDCKEMS